MKLLSGEEEKEAINYLERAAEIAKNSFCLRSKCGSVIVKDGEIIGQGFNSPPKNAALEKCMKDDLPEDFKSDRTCCVHAEQRAIMDSLRKGNELAGARLYFIRLDEKGEKAKAGEPYCTICSKMALDAGIEEFVLWREQGICVYDTDEYNKLSFQYRD
jgi:dCMP deaminase